MKISLIGAYILIFLFSGQLIAKTDNNANSIIAVYKGGSITKSEFINRLGKRRMWVLRNKSEVKIALLLQAFEDIKYLEAVSLGIDKKPKFIKKINEHIRKKLLLPYFLKKTFPTNSQKFSFKLYRIRQIVLTNKKRYLYKNIELPDPNRFEKMKTARKLIKDRDKLTKRLQYLAYLKIRKWVKKSKAELINDEKLIKIIDNKNTSLLRKILEETSKLHGSNFGSLAKKFSQDKSGKNGGHLGYMLGYEREFNKKIQKAIRSLRAGDITPIIKTSTGHHLFMCDKAILVTDKNINKYFKKDKRRIPLLRKIWLTRVWMFIEKTIKNDPYIKLYTKNLNSANPQSILFSIKSPQFKYSLTLSELIKMIKNRSIYSRRGYRNDYKGKNRPLSLHEKSKFLNWYISIPILKYSAYKHKITETMVFKEAVKKASIPILSKTITEQKKSSILITDKEIQKEYMDNKQRYTKKILDKKNTDKDSVKYILKLQPLSEVKKEIKHKLLKEKKLKVIKNWERELSKRYELKIKIDNVYKKRSIFKNQY
ncbi:MAG: peptidylprolyl isomerase [Spirochaetes bacterium]|nr:peptidylprolyl isomerase [Spirochaetota bacterium]